MSHVWGLLNDPENEWKAIRAQHPSVLRTYVTHAAVLALVPVVAGYIGTTHVGWRIVEREIHTLTPDSARPMALASYLTLLAAVFFVGQLIHWMEKTYGGKANFADSIALAAHTATPLFLVGITLIYPLLWLNLLIGLPALAYAVYLLYTGVPIMTNIPKERGFLFASAVLAVGLVMFVGVLAATVILWSAGVGPVVAG